MDRQRGGPQEGKRRQTGTSGGTSAGEGAAATSGVGASGDAPAGKTFDPRAYLRQIRVRGGQSADYLDVKWRLVWLRSEHPDAQIQTEHVSLSEDGAVFKASVEIPGGGCATGYGSESRADFTDYIEKAETKAIGRALAALGYGTQFALDFDLEEAGDDISARLADAPVERAPQQRENSPPPTERAPTMPASPSPASPATPRMRAVPPPTPEPLPEADEADEPDVEHATPQASTGEERAPVNLRALRDERASQGRGQGQGREPFEPADYSWTEFWKWARGLGYKSRTELGELLGIEVDEMTPHEVRRRLIEYRSEQGLDT